MSNKRMCNCPGCLIRRLKAEHKRVLKLEAIVLNLREALKEEVRRRKPMTNEASIVPVDQFKPVDKKLLKWAQNLSDNPHEFTYVLYNQARRIEQLEAKLARSDRKEIEAVYRKLGELEATIKRVERLLPFTSLCCQTVVRYAAIKRALGEST